MARMLKVYCKVCKGKSYITKTERVHPEISKIYCSCKNPDCNHRFVMNLEYSHTTRTSSLVQDDLISQLVANLSDKDKQLLKVALGDG